MVKKNPERFLIGNHVFFYNTISKSAFFVVHLFLQGTPHLNILSAY